MDFLGIMSEIDSYLPEGEDEEDDESMGGYFSQN